MSFIGALKNFVGFGTDEDYDEEDYYEDEDLEEEPHKAQTFKRPSRVVPIGSGHGNSKIKIIKPMSFDDSIKVADEIKERRLVIFDVGNMDGDEARRVVDFVAGAVYGLSGNIRRVSGGIFVAAPSNIDITGDNLQAQTKNSFDWNM